MARLPRLELPGWPHLLCLQAQAGEALVRDAEDRKALWLAMVGASRDHPLPVHAYAVGPGEVWLLLTPPQSGVLGAFVQSIGRRYVAAFNHRHARRGSLWAGRYRATVLEPARYLLDAMVFVESRPDIGVSGEPGSSSLAHHLMQRTDALVQDHLLFWGLGNTPFDREAAWRRRLDAGLPGAVTDALQEAVRKGWALGSPEALATMSAGTARPLVARPRGRPRKASV